MNDLEYSLGLDVGPLQQSTQQARGILGAFRSEQEKLMSAVGRLTEVQNRVQLERLANYRPEIILQREILGLKQTIANIEGTSLAKVEAQILLSQKQLQLERMIAAERVKGGVDFSSVAKGAAAATTQTTVLARAMGQLVNVSGALKGALGSLLGIGASLASPAIADQLARWVTGFSKAQEEALEKTVELTEKAAEAQEKALEKVRAAKQKESEEAAERIAREYELLRTARINAYEEMAAAEKRYRQSVYDAQETADKEHRQHVEENLEMLMLEAKAKRGLTEEEHKRLTVLRDQAKAMERQQEITTLLTLTKRTPEEEALLQKLLQQDAAYKSQLATGKQLVEVAKERLATEEEVARAKWAGSIDVRGRGDSQLSDAELERKARTLEQALFETQIRDMFPMGLSLFGASILDSQDPLKGMKASELARTLAVQRGRDETRRNVEFFGEDRARQMFDGTDAEFRAAFQGFVSKQDRFITALEKLERSTQAIPETLKSLR